MQLKQFNCPTLLVFGELDKMVNLENGKKFSNLVKNSIFSCKLMVLDI